MPKILIVEDDVAFCRMLEAFLKKKGFDVLAVFSGEEALRTLQKEKDFDLVLTDVRLPDKDGNFVLEKIAKNHRKTKVILMTGYAEVNLAVDAMKMGASDYISKPVPPDKLLKIIQHTLSEEPTAKKGEKRTASISTKENLAKTTFIQGSSDASKKLEDYIGLVAPTNMSVLIIGDSGTGKEVVAKKIHRKSKRAEKPFVAVDCGAIPKEIASSEFFGHVKGSFTGAVNDKTGHFVAANEGSLFLDEIGNLSYELQIQLLRALQERKVKPVGSNTETQVDIRVIAATNEDLEKAVEEGRFREDLYHRLNEFSVKVPRLANRREDIILLADHFLDKANEELDKEIVGFEDEVLAIFKHYSWPGNLRELQNVIKRAVLLSSGKLINSAALPPQITQPDDKTENYHLFKNKNEQQLIRDALEKAGGNKSKAARILEIDRKTLYNKLKQYQIDA